MSQVTAKEEQSPVGEKYHYYNFCTPLFGKYNPCFRLCYSFNVDSQIRWRRGETDSVPNMVALSEMFLGKIWHGM